MNHIFTYAGQPEVRVPVTIYTNIDLNVEEHFKFKIFCEENCIRVHPVAFAGTIQVVFKKVSDSKLI